LQPEEGVKETYDVDIIEEQALELASILDKFTT
jgi:hypothetical protein